MFPQEIRQRLFKEDIIQLNLPYDPLIGSCETWATRKMHVYLKYPGAHKQKSLKDILLLLLLMSKCSPQQDFAMNASDTKHPVR